VPEGDLPPYLNSGGRHNDAGPQHIDRCPSESGRLAPTQTGVSTDQHQRTIGLRDLFDQALNLVL
jgi:hypothetical protein